MSVLKHWQMYTIWFIKFSINPVEIFVLYRVTATRHLWDRTAWSKENKLNQSNIEANIDPLGILSLTLKARNYPNISQALP